MKVSWDDYSKYTETSKMFQTTNQMMGDDLRQLFFLDIGDNQFFG